MCVVYKRESGILAARNRLPLHGFTRGRLMNRGEVGGPARLFGESPTGEVVLAAIHQAKHISQTIVPPPGRRPELLSPAGAEPPLECAAVYSKASALLPRSPSRSAQLCSTANKILLGAGDGKFLSKEKHEITLKSIDFILKASIFALCYVTKTKCAVRSNGKFQRKRGKKQ